MARCLFSLISAALVTSAIMKPGIEAGIFGVRKAGRSKLSAGVDEQGDPALRNCANLGHGEGDHISGKGDRLSVEIAARNDAILASVKTSGLSVGGIGFPDQTGGGEAKHIHRRANDLRMTADAVWVLHAGIVLAMRLTDLAAVQKSSHRRGRRDLSRMPAQRVNFWEERRG